MSALMEQQRKTGPSLSWTEANRAYIEGQLGVLRSRLARRVLWLRSCWKGPLRTDYRGMVVLDEEVDRILDGAGSEEEWSFYQRDERAAEISKRIEGQGRELRRLASQMASQSSPPALGILSQLLGLSPFERSVLLLGLAPQIEAGFERLFAYVQDDASQRRPTWQLACILWGDRADSPQEACNSFGPDRPLRRFHLLQFDSDALNAPFRIDRRICDYLLGINRIDQRVADCLQPLRGAAAISARQQALVQSLASRLKTMAEGERPPLINLVGLPESGRRLVARSLCSHLGIGAYEVDQGRLAASAVELRKWCRLLEREAILLPFAHYLDCSEPASPDGGKDSAIQALLAVRTLSFLASRSPWPTQREAVTVTVPKAQAAEQHVLWRAALAKDGGPWREQLVGQIVQQFDLGPGMIAAAAEGARQAARLRDPAAAMTPDDLWESCRRQAAKPAAGLVQAIQAGYGWQDIVLPSDALSQLKDIAAQVAHRRQVYDEWGFKERLKRGRGISALFTGASGTGKTMAAEILAGHLKLDLYRIDLSAVVSKYIGETEKNLRRVFDTAEQSGAILFFDEADALFGKRSQVKDSHDRYANIEINYLLQRMEDYQGLSILATNRKSHLDDAFLRRIRFLVQFPFPDPTLRRRIWQGAFPARAAVNGLDFAALSGLEIAGGNIVNIALNAAFLAADQGRPIGMEQVMRAARYEYAKIDKLVLENEFGPYYRMVTP